MKISKTLITIPMIFAMSLLASCSGNATSTTNTGNTNITTVSTEATSTANTTSTTTYAAGSEITLNNQSVTLTEAGSYTIKGSIANGSLIVDAWEDKEIILNLAGVNITSSDFAAIYIKSGKATINLVDGTTNTLVDGKTYANQVDEEPNATLFAKEDLTIKGNGALVVTGNLNDGISTKDDLIIESGNITVTATDDGIRGKDSLTVKSGTYKITSGGDALKSDDETKGIITIDGGDFTIAAKTDGMQAYNTLTINNGNINIVESEEGIESEKIIFNGGNINIKATDDGINASSSDTTTTTTTGMGGHTQADNSLSIELNGGNITMDIAGDGIDSNGNVTMKGGTVIVYGPSNSGNGAMDYDGTFNISGGEIIAIGAGGMAMSTSSTSSQSAVLIGTTSTIAANSKITIKNSSGQTIFETTSPKTFSSVMYSSSELKTGETYTYAIGSETGNFTVSSANTTVGNVRAGGMGGRGGRMMPSTMAQ